MFIMIFCDGHRWALCDFLTFFLCLRWYAPMNINKPGTPKLCVCDNDKDNGLTVTYFSVDFSCFTNVRLLHCPRFLHQRDGSSPAREGSMACVWNRRPTGASIWHKVGRSGTEYVAAKKGLNFRKIVRKNPQDARGSSAVPAIRKRTPNQQLPTAAGTISAGAGLSSGSGSRRVKSCV